MIANSGGNEWGGLYGGAPGDQTGREWCVREWYSCPWLVVLRHPEQRLAREFAYLARRAAGNDEPTCVKHCQAHVLTYGNLEELSKKLSSKPKQVLYAL